MKRGKIALILTALYTLCLSACVFHSSAVEDGQKQDAAKARIELGLAYLQQGDAIQAKRNFDKAWEHAPNSYLVHSAFAYFYQRQGEVSKAQDEYEIALKLAPNQGDVLNNYGAFLCAQGQYQKAYAQLNLALKSQNYYRQADTQENIALCALSEKNITLYQQSIQELIKLDANRARKLVKQQK